MRTGGEGNFELDWGGDLIEADDVTPITRAITAVLQDDADLDADVGCIGLAAAEVVAALRGHPSDDLPQEVTGWVTANWDVPPEALVTDCRAAVARIRDPQVSELCELWEEGGDPATEWHAILDDLVGRLA